jgi:hypothetical protein
MYEAETDHKISYGKYAYCDNKSSYCGKGYYLTHQNVNSNNISYDNLLYLIIHMNDILLNDTSFIEVTKMDNTVLFDSSCNKLIRLKLPKYTFFEKISDDIFKTELNIKFYKYIFDKNTFDKNTFDKNTFDKNTFDKNTFDKNTFDKKLIFQKNIIIDDILKYSDNKCNICMEEIKNESIIEKNKYISPCGHLFHMDCIWNYIKSKRLYYPIHLKCIDNCCNTNKNRTFDCPTCRYKILK